MSKRSCTEEMFLKDVAEHEMNILLDTGLYRCVKFAKPTNSFNMYFTLTTWPGFLCISGDMGCFVFSRLTDMFEFFRTDRDINPQYWAEKVQAQNCHGNGIEEYDEEVFHERVKEVFEQHEFDSEEEKQECWKEITYSVLRAENEYEAHDQARQFECNDFTFSDFWENKLRSYTYHYLWCCYAIKWGIQQYDKKITDKVLEVMP